MNNMNNKTKNIITALATVGCLAVAGTLSVQAQFQAPQQGGQQQGAQPRQGQRVAPGQQPGQQTEAASRKDEIVSELEQLQKRAGEINDKLAQIEKQANEKNPEITEKKEALFDIYEKKLEEYGYPDQEEIQKLSQMQQKLQAGDLDAAERQEIRQEFQQKVQQMDVAKRKAQNDKDIQKAQEDFEQERSTTMNSISTDVGALQEELEGIQTKFEKLRMQLQQVMQRQQGGGQRPPQMR